MRAPRLVTRALVTSFLTVALVLGAVFAVLTVRIRDQVRQAVADNLASAQQVFTSVEARRRQDLRGSVATLAESPTLKAALDTWLTERRGANEAASQELLATVQREANKILAEGGHPRHHPWLLGHRLDLSRLGYLVADPDAGHVYRGHPRGGGKCRHAAPGWLACTDDLRPVVESSGGPARWQPPPATG